jgi:hypothetical protein
MLALRETASCRNCCSSASMSNSDSLKNPAAARGASAARVRVPFGKSKGISRIGRLWPVVERQRADADAKFKCCKNFGIGVGG